MAVAVARAKGAFASLGAEIVNDTTQVLPRMHAGARCVAFLRSWAFNLFFWGWSAVAATAIALFAQFGARRGLLARMLQFYARVARCGLGVLAGVRVRVRGLERLGEGPFVLAAKHQSYGDGVVLMAEFPNLAAVAMKNLEKLPLFGRILSRAEMIVVDNRGGEAARRSLSHGAERAVAAGRPILIYPEGHLVRIGDTRPYRRGVWRIHHDHGVPVYPVATNLGLRWSCQDMIKRPGEATVEILEPLPEGLGRDRFMEELEAAVETRSTDLIAEAGR